MDTLTDKQVTYHQYLNSPVWRAKREEAFAYHGTTCNRCPAPGIDVHHRTYIRVGGAEEMPDLEILCRRCHIEHHRVRRSKMEAKIKRKARRKGKVRLDMHSVSARLTGEQRRRLQNIFRVSNHQLNLGIMKHGGIYRAAFKMVSRAIAATERRR